MKVKVGIVTNFGREEFLPLCSKTKHVAEWLGKKHLSKIDLQYLELLDFEVIQCFHKKFSLEKLEK